MEIIKTLYRTVFPFSLRKFIFRHAKQWHESKEVVDILDNRYHLGKKRGMIFYDIYLSWYRFGATAEDYLGFDFLHKTKTDRQEYFTEHDNEKFLGLMSDAVSCDILKYKNLFNTHFSSLIRRDWEFIDSSNAANLETFAKRHKSIVVKPFNTGEGVGVERLIYPQDKQRLKTLSMSVIVVPS